MMANEVRVLTLAGIAQTAALVQQLARRGEAQAEPFRWAIRSALVLDSTDVRYILSGCGGVYLGLAQLARPGRAEPASLERLRYGMGLIQLQKNLRRAPRHMARIRERLLALALDPDADDGAGGGAIQTLAELYNETLSELKPRIMVQGERRYLESTEVPNQIRALLLAGVRVAYLWHDLGGRKYQLFLHRKAIVETAGSLLRNQVAT